MPTPQPLRSSLSKPDIVKINPPEFSPESDSCIHNILQYTNISFYYILKLTFIIEDWSCPAIMARLLSRLTESYNMISNFKHLGRRTTFIISLSLSLSLADYKPEQNQDCREIADDIKCICSMSLLLLS